MRAVAAEAVHAAGDRLQLRQRRGDGVRGFAKRMQRAGDREQVVDIEAPEQRRLHAGALVADDQVEADASGIQHARSRRAASACAPRELKPMRARAGGQAARSSRP